MSQEPEQLDPTDIQTLLRRFVEAARRRDLLVETLGEIGEYPLLLFRAPAPGSRPRPRLLLAAGFHGDEPAGCWGALHFLEHADSQLLDRIELSVLPIINPTGIRRATRRNEWGQNPNEGFFHPSPSSPGPSIEGKLLLSNLERLRELGAEGFLSLHEDVDQKNYYIYTCEPTPVPGPFSAAMVAAGQRFFPVVPDGPLEEGQAKDGVLYNICGDTFDDAMFHRGIARVACTETPGLLDFTLRVAANSAIVERFCKFSLPND